MAAWVDRALPAAEAAAADAHVADCARCQTVLAVLSKTLPALAQPVAWWRRGWAVGALVPLAGGALALALWIATPHFLQAPASPKETMAPAVAENAPPAETPALLDRDKQKADTPAPARGRAASPAQAKKESADARKESAEAVDQLRRADAAPAPPPAAAPAAAAAPVAAPAAPPTPAAEARQAAPARALGLTLNKTAASVEVVSPDPSVRWRIGAGGSIQRSGDGGATWTAQASGVAQDLIAGMAPQRGVCWVVGRAGTVVVLTNGNLWRHLEFPESVDLVRIDAQDGLVATVTAADGRQFKTADGGQTWSRLQDF
jgi:hypothetical protein